MKETYDVELRGETRGFQTSFQKAQKTVSKSMGTMERDTSKSSRQIKLALDNLDRTRFTRLQTGLKNLGRSMGTLRVGVATLAGTAGLVGLQRSLSGTIDKADRFAKLAQKINVPVEDISALAHAAELSGTNIDVLSNGLKRLSTNLLDAKRGLKEPNEAFEALGISITDASGRLRPVESVLLDVARRFNAMEDSTEKTALALKLFGRAGAELIPMLNQGAAGIREMKDEAVALGKVINEKMAKDAQKFNDDMTRLGASAEKLKIGLAKDLLPAMTEISDAMTVAAEKSGFWMSMWVGLGGAGSKFYGSIFESTKEMLGFNDEADQAAGNVETFADKVTTLSGRIEAVNERVRELNKQQGELTFRELTEASESLGKELRDLNQELVDLPDEAQTDIVDRLKKSIGDQQIILDRGLRKIRVLEEQHRDKVGKIKETETAKLKDELAKQLKLRQQYKDDLAALESQGEELETEFDERDQRLQQTGGEPDKEPPKPTLLSTQQVLGEGYIAQGAGDYEEAIKKFREAGTMLEEVEGKGAAFRITLQQMNKEAGTAAQAAIEKQKEAAEGGMTEAEGAVTSLVNQIGELDSLQIGFDKEHAQQSAEELRKEIQAIYTAAPITLPVVIDKPEVNTAVDDLLKRNLPGKAAGGLMYGPGTETSDSILARLSRNEFVHPARSVHYYGMGVMEALRRRLIPREALQRALAGGLPKFATGGPVLPSLPRVSAPVSSGPSGTPVNLSLDGQTFPMTAQPDVVGDLKRTFARENLKRGGRR